MKTGKDVTAVSDNDALLLDFTENYFEKLFYFCLKKTGNAIEAQDLTSDIALSVISSLRSGTAVENFPAWVWQVARNRYSVWVDGRRKKVREVSGADIGDFELADGVLVENEYIHKEDLRLLRRELAFISSDYREIVLEYYINDKSVSDIAHALGLPRGTIMSRLFRARKILSEGMNMAREFGVLSYKPENMGFIMNGTSGSLGEPYSIMNRRIAKNIMLAAYRNPSTAEELSIELGIALPYMEDELNCLESSTLMRKNGDKYETSLVIISAEAQRKINENRREITTKFTKAVIALLEYRMKTETENGSRWHEGYQPLEDAKWALLMRQVDYVDFRIAEKAETKVEEYKETIGKSGHTKRPNGGEWDLICLEAYDGDRPCFVGEHGCNTSEVYASGKKVVNFSQFKFKYKDIEKKTPEMLTYDEGLALVAAAEGDFSAVDANTLDALVGYGYLKKDAEKYTPTFLVKKKANEKPFTEEQSAEFERLYKTAVDIGYLHYDFCRETICSEVPDFLKNDDYQIELACFNIFMMRGAVLEEALKQGYIGYSDDDKRTMLGAILEI